LNLHPDVQGKDTQPHLSLLRYLHLTREEAWVFSDGAKTQEERTKRAEFIAHLTEIKDLSKSGRYL